MFITRRELTSLLALCIPQLRGVASVRRRHLMTATLNTRRVLSRFCLHSHRDEVLGGPRWSITSEGSSCSPVFGPGFSSRALTNCLWIASGRKKAPSSPLCHCLLTNAPRLPLPDTCLPSTFCSAPSDGLLCILAWLTMSCFISTAAGSPASHRLVRPFTPVTCIHLDKCDFFFFFALPPPLWLWLLKALFFSPLEGKISRGKFSETNAEGGILHSRLPTH